MSSEADIRKYIKAIVGIDNLSYSELCQVVSVDESEMTCEVISTDQVTYTDVRLMADEVESNKGFFLKPKVDSWVMITPQNESTYFVSMYSEIDEIWLHGFQYGGLVKISELVDKLNNLELTVNALITAYNSHTHNVTAVGSPTGPSLAPGPSPLIPTLQPELENNSVKHG